MAEVPLYHDKAAQGTKGFMYAGNEKMKPREI